MAQEPAHTVAQTALENQPCIEDPHGFIARGAIVDAMIETDEDVTSDEVIEAMDRILQMQHLEDNISSIVS